MTMALFLLVGDPQFVVILRKDEVQKILHVQYALGVVVAELDTPSNADRPRIPLPEEAAVDLFQTIVCLNDYAAVFFEDCVPGFAENKSRPSRNQFFKHPRVLHVPGRAKVTGDSFGRGRIASRYEDFARKHREQVCRIDRLALVILQQDVSVGNRQEK